MSNRNQNEANNTTAHLQKTQSKSSVYRRAHGIKLTTSPTGTRNASTQAVLLMESPLAIAFMSIGGLLKHPNIMEDCKLVKDHQEDAQHGN